MLPDVTRRQLLDGDWTAGAGLALSEFDRAVHVVPAFDVPEHWFRWAALDWGYHHPYACCYGAEDPDGQVYIVDTVWGRRKLPHEIAEHLAQHIPVTTLRMFHAGRDCWNVVKARGENTPTIAEQFQPYGIMLTPANIDRVSGLNTMRRYITTTQGRPRCLVMDTPGNQRLIEQIESIVTDPDRPEDALKVDADDYGIGGDDGWDAFRYLLAARPLAGTPLPPAPLDPFAPETLAATEERGRKIAHDGRTQARALPKHWKPPTGRY